MKQKSCIKCTASLFKIIIFDCCTDCKHNGAWTEDGYIYDEKKIRDLKLERNEAEVEGSCFLGATWNMGCYLFICFNCGHESNLAAIDT